MITHTKYLLLIWISSSNMRKILYILVALAVVSCSEKVKAEHKYTVISNNYQDTCEVSASDWRTHDIVVPDGWHNKVVGTNTIFYSFKGDSKVINVNKTIAQ